MRLREQLEEALDLASDRAIRAAATAPTFEGVVRACARSARLDRALARRLIVQGFKVDVVRMFPRAN